MQIGKPLRTFVVEPLELPIRSAVPSPEHDEPQQVSSTHEPEPQPEHDPATP